MAVCNCILQMFLFMKNIGKMKTVLIRCWKEFTVETTRQRSIFEVNKFREFMVWKSFQPELISFSDSETFSTLMETSLILSSSTFINMTSSNNFMYFFSCGTNNSLELFHIFKNYKHFHVINQQKVKKKRIFFIAFKVFTRKINIENLKSVVWICFWTSITINAKLDYLQYRSRLDSSFAIHS